MIEVRVKMIIGISIAIVLIFISLSNKNTTYEIKGNSEIQSSSIINEEISIIYVQVSGAVEEPGLYEMQSGDRINDLLLEAKASDYNQQCINLAQKLVDEQNLYVPSKDEGCVEESSVSDDGVVNINSASQYELETIPGIGESKANAIVEYRTQNGSFESTEALLDVDGISEGLLASINPYIRLS